MFKKQKGGRFLEESCCLQLGSEVELFYNGHCKREQFCSEAKCSPCSKIRTCQKFEPEPEAPYFQV